MKIKTDVLYAQSTSTSTQLQTKKLLNSVQEEACASSAQLISIPLRTLMVRLLVFPGSLAQLKI